MIRINRNREISKNDTNSNTMYNTEFVLNVLSTVKKIFETTGETFLKTARRLGHHNFDGIFANVFLVIPFIVSLSLVSKPKNQLFRCDSYNIDKKTRRATDVRARSYNTNLSITIERTPKYHLESALALRVSKTQTPDTSSRKLAFVPHHLPLSD